MKLISLNGPGWSRFFEYVAILYATVMRRFSNAVLAGLVALSTGALLHLAVTSLQGDVIDGWSLEPEQIYIGFTRMMCLFLRGCCFAWTGCAAYPMPLGGAAS